MKSIFKTLKNSTKRQRRSIRKRRSQKQLNFEALQPRTLLATFATTDGAWSDSSTWSNGVPDASQRAIINQGVTVELDGADHFAQELVIQGNLVVTEDASTPNKTLEARRVHVNSFGVFSVGSENDRYDEGTFTLNLTGTDPESDHMIEGVAMPVMNNDGFLMTAGQGRIQFFGEEKLSFTKLAATTFVGANTITVENIIERNFSAGASNGEVFVTSAADDGEFNWAVGDQIFIGESNSDREFTFLGEYDFVDGSGPELIELTDIDLSSWAGSDRVIRIEIVGQFMGLDYLEFTSKSSDQSDPNAEIVVPTIGPTNSHAEVVTIDFDEDVFGFDIGDLILTRDANKIDISGLVLTQLSPNQYTIDLSAVTTEDGTYELSLNHAGSGIADSAGNAMATDALDQFMIDFGGDTTFLPGDLNQDGVVNFLDISPFISILSNGGFLDEADTNGDGAVDFLDISSFIAALTRQ